MAKLSSLLSFLLAGWLLPLLLTFMVYHGFSTNYTTNVFSELGFREQYEAGIYKYCVLGNNLLLTTYHLIENCNCLRGGIAPQFLKTLDPRGSAIFYAAYFVNNALFLCLACSTLYLLLQKIVPSEREYERGLAYLCMCFLMTITQYVIVPYDTLSYFLLVVAIFFAVAPQSKFTFFSLGLTVVLATLTRESAVPILSFYFTLHFPKFLVRSRIHMLAFGALLVEFLVTYLSLRVALGSDRALFLDVRLRENINTRDSVAGISLLVTMLLMLVKGRSNKDVCLLFLLFSTPYIAMMILVANTWSPGFGFQYSFRQLS